jgi:hypothetical protein
MKIDEGIDRKDEEILVNAAHIGFLQDAVKVKLSKAPPDEILDLLNKSLPDEMASAVENILNESISNFIEKFIQACSFDSANTYANKICKISSLMSPIQKEAVLSAFCKNNQLYRSFNAPSVIKHIFDEDTKDGKQFEPYWLSFRQQLHDTFPNDFEDLKRIIDLSLL